MDRFGHYFADAVMVTRSAEEEIEENEEADSVDVGLGEENPGV